MEAHLLTYCMPESVQTPCLDKRKKKNSGTRGCTSSHIWVEGTPEGIGIKFCIWVDIYDIVKWYRLVKGFGVRWCQILLSP